MNAVGFLLRAFREFGGREALIWQGKAYTYHWLLERVAHWDSLLRQHEVSAGQAVVVEGDFSPNSVALLLSLIQSEAIVIPLTKSVREKRREFIEIAGAEIAFALDDKDEVAVEMLSYRSDNELYANLRMLSHPGLILFSSGSTGKSKAAVHDFAPLLDKFRVRRHALRTITFLLFDHIGGVNTLFYTLSNGGCVINVSDRTPDAVLSAIQNYKVELLPTSPTFLNLILLSEAYKRNDLTSLKTITYGTEAMPESTLKRFHSLFPDKQLLQTYGLSELGILRSKSKSSDSLWVKIGGEGFETRVVDGILQIKAKSAMLGYLNAPSPFTSDGWFITGDSVEVNGEYLRILGRKSEIINVGGEKVYPSEVESVIQEMENVAEVTVYSEKNAITGSIVCAALRLKQEEDPKAVMTRVKDLCRSRLQSFKVPVKLQVVSDKQYSERFKKMRNLL